jgi:hypothetical protein
MDFTETVPEYVLLFGSQAVLSASRNASRSCERRILLSVWRLEDMSGKYRVLKYFRISVAVFDQVLVLLGQSPAFQNTEMRKLGRPNR